MGKRVLITGSEGTLGVPLARALESDGHVVFGCDLKHSHKVNHMRADIANLRQLERVFEWSNPDVVYALAAEFGRNNGEDFYEQLWRTNALGTQNVIEACLKHKAHMVFASSSEAYGELKLSHPDDMLYESLLEDRVPLFHNNYALSKWTNEKQVEIAIRNRGLQATILRFFNAYGPGEYYHPYRSVVCLFAYRLLHGLPITIYKNYRRVFMYVDDWAATVSRIADRYQGWPSGKIFNIGGDEYTTVEEMYDTLITSFNNLNIEVVPNVTYLSKEAANVTNKRPDNTEARVLLDHDPEVLLSTGLPLTAEWMMRQYTPTLVVQHSV